MQEVLERKLDIKEIEKAVCRFAKMSEPSCGTKIIWHVGDKEELLGATIRQRGRNQIDGQTDPKEATPDHLTKEI